MRHCHTISNHIILYATISYYFHNTCFVHAITPKLKHIMHHQHQHPAVRLQRFAGGSSDNSWLHPPASISRMLAAPKSCLSDLALSHTRSPKALPNNTHSLASWMVCLRFWGHNASCCSLSPSARPAARHRSRSNMANHSDHRCACHGLDGNPGPPPG